MTDGTRVLKTVAVPLAIALLFLFFVPKTCEKMLASKKLKAASASTAAPTDTGLHISSDAPSAAPASAPTPPSNYPAGLDAQRVQYEIEINQRFADPFVYRLPKPGGVIVALDPAPAEAMARAGWFEQAAGGGYTPTPEAALHLPQMSEEPQAWRVPLGARKFVRVTSVEDLGDGKARVGFSWQWEPNEAGRAARSTFDLHQGTAEFAGGGEHSWDVSSLVIDNDWR
jgi:hypothetical protein